LFFLLDRENVSEGEVAGQLYAFRVSEFAVYLETRDSAALGAAIGISSTASGEYTCVAMNANENSVASVSVNIIGKDFFFQYYFLFFSSFFNLYFMLAFVQFLTIPIWSMLDFLPIPLNKLKQLRTFLSH